MTPREPRPAAFFDTGRSRTYPTPMAKTPPEKATLRESLAFFAKLVLYLAGLSVFGFVIYLLTRSMLIHR